MYSGMGKLSGPQLQAELTQQCYDKEETREDCYAEEHHTGNK